MTKRRNQRRSGRRNLIPRSTLRVMPFLQYLGRQTAVIAAGGITNFPLTAATLASDLVSHRLVKFSNFVVKFYPTLQTSVQASVQLSVVDQATTQLVPITQIKPLSTVNQTSFSGSLPAFQGWVQAGSGSNALVIIFYSTGPATFYYDVQTRMSLSQDLLS
jgi:hypothetical protein